MTTCSLLVRGVVVADHVRVATSLRERTVGLLNARELPDGHALLLRPCGGIHTCAMRFAIDVVFLDAQDRVTATVTRLKPWRMRLGPRTTRSTLELPCGWLGKVPLAKGDRLEFRGED